MLAFIVLVFYFVLPKLYFMAIVMSMKWEGVTPDQYEQARKVVNWEGDQPQGGMFHVAGFHNNTLRVTDIWESENDFNAFVQSRLMPGVAQIGIQGEPQVEMFPVQAIYLPDASRLQR
jgi:hypothetical protein